MKKLFLAMIAASTIIGIAFYVGNPSERECLATAGNVGQSMTEQSKETASASSMVIVRSGEKVLHAEWENTELAREIQSHFPLTVDMVHYGGREYYGSLDWTPKYRGKGKLNFDNGDITYCARNNTLAIFYAQTDHPNLTMEVIRVGRIKGEDIGTMHRFGNREKFIFALP